MIDTTAIRNKILFFAMSGQLTEQIDEDGRASDLLLRNNNKRSQLEKTGKIKREKKLPAPPDEEKYFEIPSSWEWIYMGDIFLHNTGKALNSSDTEGVLLDYITTSNLYWDRFELDSLKQMRFKPEEIEKCTITKGDLLVCEGGDIGRSAIWKFDYDMRIQNHIHKLRAILAEEICAAFYYYVMMLYKQNNWINGRGIGLQGFSSKRLHTLVVPLPPYAEQLRIVEVVKEIFEILDTIDALQRQYTDDKEILKNKLIEAGIQGRLSEQLPEDGDAEDLYGLILEKKAKQIKEGKAKKEKPLPPISTEEIPYEIPRNWKWVRLGDLIRISSGTGLTSYQMKDGDIPVYGGNGITGYHSEALVEEETIVIGRVGFYCGSVHITPAKAWVTDNAFITEYPKEFIDQSFLVYALRHMDLRQNTNGAAQPVVSGKKIYPLLFALPPLAEQKRIANQLDRVISALEMI